MCSEVVPVQSEQTLCVTSLMSSWKSLLKTVSMRVQEEILCPSDKRRQCYILERHVYGHCRHFLNSMRCSSKKCVTVKKVMTTLPSWEEYVSKRPHPSWLSRTRMMKSIPESRREAVITPGSLAWMSRSRSPTVVNIGVSVKRHCRPAGSCSERTGRPKL